MRPCDSEPTCHEPQQQRLVASAVVKEVLGIAADIFTCHFQHDGFCLFTRYVEGSDMLDYMQEIRKTSTYQVKEGAAAWPYLDKVIEPSDKGEMVTVRSQPRNLGEFEVVRNPNSESGGRDVGIKVMSEYRRTHGGTPAFRAELRDSETSTTIYAVARSKGRATSEPMKKRFEKCAAPRVKWYESQRNALHNDAMGTVNVTLEISSEPQAHDAFDMRTEIFFYVADAHLSKEAAHAEAPPYMPDPHSNEDSRQVPEHYALFCETRRCTCSAVAALLG